MTTQPSPVPGNAAGARPVPRGLYRAAVAAIVVATLAVAYQFYDMACPNTFVGDMYGLIVLVRLVPLVACGVVLTAGGVLAVVGWTRRRRGPVIAGAVIAIAATLPILGMAGHVAWERHRNAVRATYPDRSVEDLLRLANEEHDQFAVGALSTKGDLAAVPGLRAMLLDPEAPTNLRICAAQAIANLGGPEAREALETARDGVTDPDVQRAVGYALESLDAMAGEAPGPAGLP
ncbi:MAG: HEAT repeat domain-containing protein [Planctomycetes bacterium]|nr:HEAT repeat domain-containing protein [Planctomycetota bacterium]